MSYQEINSHYVKGKIQNGKFPIFIDTINKSSSNLENNSIETIKNDIDILSNFDISTYSISESGNFRCENFGYQTIPSCEINFKSREIQIQGLTCYECISKPLPSASCTENAIDVIDAVGSFVINPYDTIPLPECSDGYLRKIKMCLRRFVYDYDGTNFSLANVYSISHYGVLTPTTSFYSFSDEDLASFLLAGGFSLGSVYQLCIDVSWERYFCVKNKYYDGTYPTQYVSVSTEEESIGTVYSIQIGEP